METAIGILVVLLFMLWLLIVDNLDRLRDWFAELRKRRKRHLSIQPEKNEYEDRMQDKVKGLKIFIEKRKVQKEQKDLSDEVPKNQQDSIMPTEEEMKEKEEKQEEDNMDTNFRTRGYFLLILKKIGCSFEVDENDRVLFTWQGGYFSAEVTDDCPFVVIWYLGWAEFELSDVDTLSRVRKVINSANIHHNMNVVYSIDNYTNTFTLHTKKHFFFSPPLKDSDRYLNAVLNEFFVVRRFVECELDKLKNQEELMQKK